MDRAGGRLSTDAAGTPEIARWVRRGGNDPECFPSSEVGGKAHGLARLEAAGARVPPWLALDAAAWDAWVARNRPPPADSAEAEKRQGEVRILPIPRPFCAEILRALDELGMRGAPLAVRSSATGEDGAGASFAGQFASVLGVRADGEGEALWDAVREVWASAWSPHAREYAAGRDAAPRMAVVVQTLVEPRVAGVAFSADPVSGDPSAAVVCAAYGLGEGVVSGDLDADTFRVDADGTVKAEVAHKPAAVRPAPGGGTRTEPVPPPLRDAPSLSDDEARHVAATARQLAAALEAPQDVEWALAPGPDGPRTLWILQARPITTLAAPAGERRVWDNSNIIESYGGVVSALTFSFARGVYEQVYRQFCALVGVPEPVIHRNRHVFAQMLGRIRGRVFYNLLNWYRVLALLPGFALNRGFMERMMGVGERLADPPAMDAGGGRLSDAARVLRTVAGLAGAHRRLDRDVPAFHAEVDAVLAPLAAEDIEAWDPDRLAALYRRLEDRLLRRWQTPIVNDFFAMIWFGTLGRLTERWLPGAPPSLVNDLLVGEGEIVSTEPARRMGALARQVRESPALVAAFAAEPEDAALWRRMERDPALAALRAEARAYLARWGDRSAEELKLETVTPAQDPALLVRTLRDYLARPDTDGNTGSGRALRDAAERRVRETLRGPRRPVFFAVLARTRRRVRDRENLRFERTRVFGVVRRIFLAMGQRLAEAGRLEQPRDIFHLTVEEVFAHLDGTGTAGDLRALTTLRRAELERWRAEPPPPDRFETTGPPDAARPSSAPVAASADSADGVLRGTGCCPGVVRAPVRLVRDPNRAGELAGHILVAERTDPGWTLLFPAVEGLLVQRGSLLSHSAIVAREVGLPCVVAIPGLLDALRDGELVEMDGTAGTVRRLQGAAEPGE